MKKYPFLKKGFLLIATLLVLVVYSFSTKKNVANAAKKENKISSNDIPIYTFETLEPLLYTESNKPHIVNFWAMWCAPCIQELPHIIAYATKNPDAEITLVSLDFPESIETKLKPFLKKKGITLNVVVLDDPDANSWIDKINPNWSGAIPYTIIFNDKKRSYHERTFESLEDLETEIRKTFN